MPLPDSFDLQVRRARQTAPERQSDFLLGSLFGLNEWIFFNTGEVKNPAPMIVELDGARYLLLFSSSQQADDCSAAAGLRKEKDPLPLITVPIEGAPLYALGFRAAQVQGVLVNPGDYAFAVDLASLENFHHEWKKRSRTEHQGFWIPNLTSEEEDFWQEKGL
jgi:hypothetical protein